MWNFSQSNNRHGIWRKLFYFNSWVNSCSTIIVSRYGILEIRHFPGGRLNAAAFDRALITQFSSPLPHRFFRSDYRKKKKSLTWSRRWKRLQERGLHNADFVEEDQQRFRHAEAAATDIGVWKIVSLSYFLSIMTVLRCKFVEKHKKTSSFSRYAMHSVAE